MLLNHYLKLKLQLSAATSVTNNYFRSARGVWALNAVAQGSGNVFTGHLEPSIWSVERSVNLSAECFSLFPSLPGPLFVLLGPDQGMILGSHIDHLACKNFELRAALCAWILNSVTSLGGIFFSDFFSPAVSLGSSLKSLLVSCACMNKAAN